MTTIRITISEHRDALEGEQRAGRDLDVAVGEEPDEHRRDQRDRGSRRVVPDARAAEERRSEEADLGDVGGDEERVRGEQRPAGEEAGARPERRARERVGRAGVVEEARQPDEGVRDQRDRDRGEEKRERHGAADEARGRDAVQRHRRRRRHDPDRDRDRLPEPELAPQVPVRARPLAAGSVSLAQSSSHLLRRSPPGTKQPTTQFGASTTSWMRRSHGHARDRVGLLAVEAVPVAEPARSSRAPRRARPPSGRARRRCRRGSSTARAPRSRRPARRTAARRPRSRAAP